MESLIIFALQNGVEFSMSQKNGKISIKGSIQNHDNRQALLNKKRCIAPPKQIGRPRLYTTEQAKLRKKESSKRFHEKKKNQHIFEEIYAKKIKRAKENSI